MKDLPSKRVMNRSNDLRVAEGQALHVCIKRLAKILELCECGTKSHI